MTATDRIESEVAAEPAGQPCAWSDRLFDAMPMRPLWTGVLLALALVGVYVLSAAIADELGSPGVLYGRDARVGVLFMVLLVYLVVARQYARRGALRTVEALAPLFAGDPAHDPQRLERDVEAVGFDRARRRRVARRCLAIVPVVALAIDRDPFLYIQVGYWSVGTVWSWTFGMLTCWNLGLLIDATLGYARHFSTLARAVPSVDLLDASELTPFASLGLRFALLWLVAAAIFCLNLVDSAYGPPVLAIALLSLAITAASVLPLVLGARDRIRSEKRIELTRVNAGLRGDPHALEGSPLARRAQAASIADLVAYRGLVASQLEWPFDAPMLLRLLLYLAIPLGSWLGGAFVERILAAALDR